MTNRSLNYYDLWLRAESPESNPPDLDLIRHIRLHLSMDGHELYNGTAAGETDSKNRSMGQDIYLGRITSESAHRLDAMFTLTGVDLDTRHQKARAQVRWIFTARRAEAPNGKDDTALDNTSEPANLLNSNGKSPDTGLSKMGYPLLIAALALILSLPLWLVSRKKHQK